MIVNGELARSNGHESKDCWRTPEAIYRKLDDEFHFTLDPCPANPDFDGLELEWTCHVCFVNPPYSRGNIDKWVKKCYDESERTLVVGLLPVSTSSDWWHNWIVGKAELRFINKRVRFVGAPFTAPFSSVIVIWGRSGIKTFNQ